MRICQTVLAGLGELVVLAAGTAALLAAASIAL